MAKIGLVPPWQAKQSLEIEKQRENQVRKVPCPICQQGADEACVGDSYWVRKPGQRDLGSVVWLYAHTARYDLAAERGLVPPRSTKQHCTIMWPSTKDASNGQPHWHHCLVDYRSHPGHPTVHGCICGSQLTEDDSAAALAAVD